MSEDSRELRLQSALANLKWWSEIVGILSSWAVVTGVTFLCVKALDRMPESDSPDFNLFLQVSTLVTVLVVLALFVIYSLRLAWLVYCWVSKMHSPEGRWFTKTTDFVTTALIVVSLFVGMFSIAASIAGVRLSFGYFNNSIITIEPR